MPKLYEDLVQKNIDCLTELFVEWKHTKVHAPKSSLEKYIFDEFLDAAAERLQVQRGDGYGFGKKVQTNQRSIVASEMEDSKLSLIQSNNLICERDFSMFSNVAEKAAKSSNRHFKAKSIRAIS